MSTYPLCVLMSSNHQLYNPGQGTVFSKRGVVGRAKGQVANKSHNSLNEGPAAWWMEKFD